MQNDVKEKLAGQLKMAGLGEKAAVIYAVLLELGGAHPSRIAEKAKLNRSTTYKILLNLSVQGLVSELKKRNKLYYQIEKPTKLVRFAKDQIKLSEDRYEKALGLVPELEGLLNTTPNKPRVRFFEGENEIIELYRDHVDVKKPYEMLAISNATEYLRFIPKKAHMEYVKAKEKLVIKTRGIIPDLPTDVRYNDVAYKNIKQAIHPQLRAIPAEIFPYSGDMTIYGNDRVSVLNMSKSGLVGVIIEDKTIHDMMRMIFELAWAGAKALY